MSRALAGRERIEQLLAALRRATAPASRDRQALIIRLIETTGLSREGIEWALDNSLELYPTPEELTALGASVAPARRAHVILPSNVFVAAHRALALALAASSEVFVKPSRREPALCDLLYAHAPGLFERVRHLDVEPGDHVFAYGSDVTLEVLRRELPAGSVLHAHGSGFGVAVVDLEAAPHGSDAERAAASALARDTACFDQRGCLSPRFVLALGSASAAERFAEILAAGLADHEREVPIGRLDPSELAEAAWYRQSAACFGRVLAAGSGAVSVRDPLEPCLLELDATAALEVPPAGRHLDVIAITRLEPALESLRPWLTAVGCSTSRLQTAVSTAFDRLRVSPLGSMQRPPFDGPVDLRTDPRGELILEGERSSTR
jgi:hypothetical protein